MARTPISLGPAMSACKQEWHIHLREDGLVVEVRDEDKTVMCEVHGVMEVSQHIAREIVRAHNLAVSLSKSAKWLQQYTKIPPYMD